MHGATEVARPAPEVFAVLADFEQNPRWQGGMRECRWLTPPPHGVGARYEQVASFLGRRIVSTFEVTAFEPDRSVTIESRQSTFPIRVTRSVEPLGPDRTRVHAEISGGPGGTWRVLAPLMRVFAQRSISADYRRLRALLEGSPAPGPGAR